MNNLTVSQIVKNYDMVNYVASITAVKKIGNESACLCLFHNDSKPSMRIYSKGGKQRYHCFVCNSKGDLIDLVRNYNGFDNNKQAIDHLTGRRESTPRKITPVKIETVDVYADFEPLPLGDHVINVGEWIDVFNPKAEKEKQIWKMKPDAVYKYDSGYVVRLVFKDSKNTPAIKWCLQKSTGLCGWCSYPSPDSNRKHYGEIKPNGVVVIFEGEKTTDAAIKIFKNNPDTSAICYSGGTNAILKTDWRVLEGRNVVYFPDNDQSGYDAARKLIGVIDGIRFVIPSNEVKGWDVADRDFTAEELFDYMCSNMGELPDELIRTMK